MTTRLSAAVLLGCLAGSACATSKSGLQNDGSSSEPLAIGEDCRNPSSGLCWPYCMDDDCRRGIVANPDAIVTRWRAWRDRHIDHPPAVLETGSVGGKRVWKSDATLNLRDTTVSEGQAYGMLFSMYFDEQPLFDDLWQFYRGTPSTAFGLMDWCIARDNTPCDASTRGAATDADEDAALALVFACKKVQAGAWSEGRFDYCADAKRTLDSIYEHEVAADGYLLPGDSWPPNAPLNPSYFSPGAYRVFDAFEDGDRWSIVAQTSYANIDAIQAAHGGCSKLVPNWADRTGAPVMPFAGSTDYMLFGWDAARITWRVALDKIWYDSDDATSTLDEMGGFFAATGARNIKPVYDMQGNTDWPYGSNAFFSANAGVAIWAADSPINPGAGCGTASAQANSTAQEAYDMSFATAEPTGEYDYYNNAWQLFGLMTMSGNTPNILARANEGGAGLLRETFGTIDFRTLNTLTVGPLSFGGGVLSARTASVRWSGTVEPRYSETYTFQATPADGLRVRVNGKAVVDSWYGANTQSGSIALRAGFAVPILVEYRKPSDRARATITWRSASQREQPIPASRLRPSASIQPAGGLEAGETYQLSLGGFCLDTAAASADRVGLTTCARSETQFLVPSTSRDGWMSLRVTATGQCLTALITRQGSQLFQRGCDGSPEQSFKIFDAGGELLRIVNRERGYVLFSPKPRSGAPIGLRRLDPAASNARWSVSALSACGDGVCAADEGCTSCPSDCVCGACSGFCPDGVAPIFLQAPLDAVALPNEAACYAVSGVPSGMWNSTNAPTTKELFLNGAPMPWGPGASVTGNACVYATAGALTDWAGFGTF